MFNDSMKKKSCLIVFCAGLLCVSKASIAVDLTTGFEFTDTSGEFVLGDEPNTVTFSDGEAKSAAMPDLYHSGMNAWMVDIGMTGSINFNVPAENVNFFFKDDDNSTAASTLTLFDTDDEILTVVNGLSNDWTEINFTPDEGSGISRITLQNNSESGYSAIDDFSFTAQGSGGGNIPLDDPIPEPIDQGTISIRLQVVADNLTAPNWGTFAPGVGFNRLFVTDQNGIIWSIPLSNSDLAVEKFVFLNTSNLLVALGAFGDFDERGLLGMAFHPNYINNGLVYTYTSEPVNGDADFSTMPDGTEADHQTVIRSWHVRNPERGSSVVNSNSSRVLLRIDQPQFNHNGGALNFGPDNLLYISLGDGGAADDRDSESDNSVVGHGTGNGQDPSNILGSVIRINPFGSNSANGQYSIPQDNPFVGVENHVEEIYAYGFRNPFRFSFDLLTGTMFLGDVGQNDIEEVNIVDSGGNYGWNIKEGSFYFDANGDDAGFVTDTPPANVPADLIDPIAEYDHDEGISVIGGFVYRGSAIPRLHGHYVFGDWSRDFLANNGRLFYLVNREIKEFKMADPINLGILGFGQDSRGAIYVLGNTTGTPFGDTGVVLKIVPDD